MKTGATAIDWKRGAICGSGDAPAAKIVFAGDWGAYGGIYESMLRSPERIYGDTREILRSGDLRVMNLECALGGDSPLVKSGPLLRGTPEHLKCLTASGVEAVTLGNNHICDYRREGLARTLSLLDAHGIAHCGAGLNREGAESVLVREVNGITVGLISFTESGSDLPEANGDGYGIFGWHPDAAAGLVAAARRACDIVVALPHAGVEHIPYPPAYIQQAYRRLAAAGADAVIAHHPHVPQGIEIHRGTPIFYSVGNYVFPPGAFSLNSRGYLVRLEISKRGVTGFEVFPYGIDARSGASLLQGEEKTEFLELLQALSEPLAEQGNEAWHGVLAARWRSGFHAETLRNDLARFGADPVRTAAVLRNRRSKTCHVNFWYDFYDRIARGVIDEAPEWAVEMTRRFEKKRIDKEGGIPA